MSVILKTKRAILCTLFKFNQFPEGIRKWGENACDETVILKYVRRIYLLLSEEIGRYRGKSTFKRTFCESNEVL